MELVDEGICFVCGSKNPIGLKLKFQFDGEEYVTHFTPREEHQGFYGITHGGLIATVLDEVMARMLWEKGIPAVTTEMHITLRQAARPGESLEFRAQIEEERSRRVQCRASAFRNDGTLVAEGWAKLIRMQRPQAQETLRRKENTMDNQAQMELVSVYEPDDESTAELVRGLLETEGINAIVREHEPMLESTLVEPGIWGEILVSEADAAHAREVIEGYQKGTPIENIDKDPSQEIVTEE